MRKYYLIDVKQPLTFALPPLDHQEVIAAPEGDDTAALICNESDEHLLLRRELADLLKRQLAKRSRRVIFVPDVHLAPLAIDRAFPFAIKVMNPRLKGHDGLFN